jgi:tetratricopeptide (TPR) repeat protein
MPGGAEAFHAAIHSDPNYPLAYFAMGATLNSQGEFADAQKTIEQGLKIEPTSWQGYFELGKAVLGQHDFRNALKYVVKAESLGGVYPPIHLVKAHALLGLKDYDEAATELEQYLAKDSTGPRADEARRALDQAKAFSATAKAE